MDNNLEELVLRAQKGDKDAFGEIYSLFYKKIYRYCQFNCNDKELAIDICQDTFLKAWQALPRFSTTNGSIQAYLFKIARNLIIDKSRKKKESSLEKHDYLETNENLEENLEKNENLQKLKNALNMLNEIDKQLIVFHYLEEMPQADVAKIVGIKNGALRVRTHRVLKKLRELIEHN